MIQIQVKGNKKCTRFFIDSIKTEINNTSDSIRLLRLKTLPDHRHSKHISVMNKQSIQQKHSYSLESQQGSKNQSHLSKYRDSRNRGERWVERDEYKQLCCQYKDKRSRLSQNLQTMDDNREAEKEIRCSLQQLQPSSSVRQTQRKAIINLDKLHLMNAKGKSNLKHNLFVPLPNLAKNCKSSQHLSRKSSNTYIIYTPQKLASLSYKEILEGHRINQSKVKPIQRSTVKPIQRSTVKAIQRSRVKAIQQIKKHIKKSRRPQCRLRKIQEKPLDRLFRENQGNVVRLSCEQRQSTNRITPLQTNLSPWRTKHENTNG